MGLRRMFALRRIQRLGSLQTDGVLNPFHPPLGSRMFVGENLRQPKSVLRGQCCKICLRLTRTVLLAKSKTFRPVPLRARIAGIGSFERTISPSSSRFRGSQAIEGLRGHAARRHCRTGTEIVELNAMCLFSAIGGLEDIESLRSLRRDGVRVALQLYFFSASARLLIALASLPKTISRCPAWVSLTKTISCQVPHVSIPAHVFCM